MVTGSMKRHSSLHGVFAVVVTLELQCFKGVLDRRLAKMAKIRILDFSEG